MATKKKSNKAEKKFMGVMDKAMRSHRSAKLREAYFGKKTRRSGSWSVTSKKRVIRRAKTTKALKRKSCRHK